VSYGNHIAYKISFIQTFVQNIVGKSNQIKNDYNKQQHSKYTNRAEIILWTQLQKRSHACH